MRGESIAKILQDRTKTRDLVLRSTPQACVSKDGRGHDGQRISDLQRRTDMRLSAVITRHRVSP